MCFREGWKLLLLCIRPVEGNRSAVTSVNLLAGHGQRAAETLNRISLPF